MRKQPPQGTEEYRLYKRALEFKYANTEHGFLKRLFQSIYSRVKGNRDRNKGWIPEITKKELAEKIGSEIAKRSIENGITEVAFDKGKYKYHGTVKIIAEAARAAGLNF